MGKIQFAVKNSNKGMGDEEISIVSLKLWSDMNINILRDLI